MILDGVYQARIHAIEKCYEATKKRGFKVFAVQDGGCCASSATAETTFDKHGPSSACGFDGEGGPGANQVYFIRGIKFAVFFNDSVLGHGSRQLYHFFINREFPLAPTLAVRGVPS